MFTLYSIIELSIKQWRVTTMTLLDVQHVQKVYQTRFGAAEVTALKDINFSVEEG